MKINDLSEREILALQYSLLEELKHSKSSVPIISQNNEITTSLSHSFEDEKKTELISARVKPTAKKIIEDSKHSYSDAIEYFASKLIGNEEIFTQNNLSAEEFIKQRVKDNNGNYETNDQYVCRLKWFELGCPKFNKFANKTDYKYQTLRKITSRFNWQKIREKAIELGYSHKKPNTFIDNTKKTIKRDSKQYNRFRESVLKRDNVCQCCGSKEDLEVHHALSFNQYNSLGADPNNGIVLCKECHTEYHSKYGYKRKNNPVTLAQFLRDYGMNPQTSLDDSKEVSEEVILKNIEEYEKDYGECSIKRLLNDFKEFGFDVKYIGNILKHLQQVGKIYMPLEGIVKVV